MLRAAFASVLALCLSSCGGGSSSSGSGPPGPAPTPSPTPTPAPTATPTPSSVSYLHVFGIEPTDGQQPNGPLIQASDGSFYGTTRAGGNFTCGSSGLGCGAIFRVTASGQEVVLKSFGSSAADGYRPAGPLIQGSDGALYGVTSFGGTFDRGTIFRITLGGAYTVLYSFGASPGDGSVPAGGLVQDTDGTIFGATTTGGTRSCFQVPGTNNCGTIFKLAADGSFTTIYNFGATSTDGVQPNGSLALSTEGMLYGTTVDGGAHSCSNSGATNNCGTAFRITKTGVLTTLHSFGSSSADGIAPQGAPVEGPDGFLYGTTASGGGGQCGFSFGCGTAYRMSKSGTLTILHAFALAGRADGYGPSPYITFGRDGFLYGTTGSGGSTQSDLAGTAFRLTVGGAKTTLVSFGPVNENPHNPVSGLVQGADGAFYGILAYNGKYGAVGARGGAGAVFKLAP